MPNMLYLRSAENSSKGTAIVSKYLLTIEYSTALGEIKPMLLIKRPAKVLTSGLHIEPLDNCVCAAEADVSCTASVT